jgi:hypothetical protein
LDRALVPPVLIRDDAEQMQTLRMIRSLAQRLTIKRLSPVAAARSVMGEPGLKIAKGGRRWPGITRAGVR